MDGYVDGPGVRVIRQMGEKEKSEIIMKRKRRRNGAAAIDPSSPGLSLRGRIKEGVRSALRGL
jgi:hypothetical protein